MKGKAMTHEEVIRKKAAFARNVKHYSKEIGGVGRLENRIGVSPGFISRVSNDKQDLRLSAVLMICDILGKTLEELCDEDATKREEVKAIDDEIERLVARRRELEG